MKNDNIDDNKKLHEKTVKENDNIDNEDRRYLHYWILKKNR